MADPFAPKESAKPDDGLNDIITRGQRLFMRSRSARSLVEARWVKSGDQYDGIFSREERKWSDVLMGQSRLFINKTYNTIQRIMVDILETFCFDPEEFVGVTQRPDIPEEKRDAVKAVLNYRLNGHPVNYYQELLEATQDGLKQKVGILKIYPRLKTEKRDKKTTKKDEATGEVVEMVDTETAIRAYEPRMECVPPEDLFLDPRFTWKDYWCYPMVHRYTRSRDYFREMGFMNADKVGGTADIAYADQLKAQRLKSGFQSPFFSPGDNPNIENLVAYEFWDFMDMDGDGYAESVTYTMLGDVTGPSVLGLPPRPNQLPYGFSEFECVRPPFVIGVPFPEAHKGYGKDMPEITESLQKETNIVRNQDREAAALSIRKPLLVNRDAGIDMQALVNRKIGAVVTGEETGPDSVRELQLSSPIINTAQISRQIDQDYFEATSITPTQLGISSNDQTATGATTTQDNANKKIAGIIKNLAYTLVLPAMRMLLRLEQAYESDEMIRLITGQVLGWKMPNDGMPAWSVIQGDFELNVDLALNKQAQVNKYMLVMDRMNQANLAMGQIVAQGMADPKDVKFANPMWALDQLLRALKLKNLDSAKIQARAPTPKDGEQPPGVASQPDTNANPSVVTQPFNPEDFLAETGASS